MLLKIVKGLLLILPGVVILIFLLLLINSLTTPLNKSTPLTSKESGPITESKDNEEFFRKLEQEFGSKKEIPDQYKKQILIALSHFPELKTSSIKFKIEKANFPLQSIPQLFTLLYPGVERKYNIIISSQSILEYEEILLNKIPWEGQIGVLGHELAHVAEYENKLSFEIALAGIKYLISEEFRKQFEKMTDIITIEHRLGNQLLKWREYYENLLTTRGRKAFKQRIYFEDRYLTASEIKRVMNKK